MRLMRLAIVITLAVAAAPLLGRAQDDAGLVGDPGIRVVRTVPPTYPEIAKSARVRGKVGIDAVVETDGRVSEARITRSIPLLDGAALAAIRDWEFAPLSARTTVTAVFEFTFEDSPRPRVPSNLWRDPEPSQDDAVILDVFCNNGTIQFVGPGTSSIDGMPGNLLNPLNQSRIHLTESEVAAIRDVARSELAPFAARLFAWRDTPPPMRVNIQERQVLAVVPTSVPSIDICMDACSGLLHGVYLRHAGVWTQLSPFGEDGAKPFYRDRFPKVEKRLRAIVRKSESFQKLPRHLRACMADV
jgi:TonB family protein